MVIGAKTVAAGVSAVGMVTLFSGMAIHFRNPGHADNDLLNVMDADEGGAVAGRIVSVPVKTYKDAFKSTLKLGQCPYRLENSDIKRCSESFSGEETFIGKGGMTVDVTRVQSSEDILTHIMGGIGASVGVLGLVSVGVKVNVAVTTETSKKSLNMMSSYVMHKGVLTLRHPQPQTAIPSGGALYLSEIELGGDELFLVTLNFKSEKEKVQVDITVTFKILFWSISAKVSFVHNTFKSQADVRIQFKSSFRPDSDYKYNSTENALPKIKSVESMYMEGPQKLRDMGNSDEKTHNFYYFASWKESPYGGGLNVALINHDTDFLTDQNIEMKSVLHRISILKDKSWPADQRRQMIQLNTTLADKATKLTTGLDNYHKLSVAERQKLRDIYGVDKAPLYYSRQLSTIIKE